jgi:hypothetical protein
MKHIVAWLAQTAASNGYWSASMHAGEMKPQVYWHVNLTDASGRLVDLSPVAARVIFDDRTARTFSISHGQYERLRNDIGHPISFNVGHDVLYATDA